MKHAPSVAKAFCVIAAMDVASRLGGFHRGLALARWLGSDADGARDCVDPGLVEDTARAVITAAVFYPRRAMCLEQSLALFALLRRRGIDAEIRFGIQTLPFSAHAWVEVDGAPVNEKHDQIEQLVTFQHVGA
jgi:hypothetical protein